MTNSHQPNQSVFKRYDVRGKYPQDLNEEKAQKIGRAFLQFSKAQKIVLGRDKRASSPGLLEALKEGLKKSKDNLEVVDLGLTSTPQLVFTIAHFKFPAGIMITASHLPGKFNGFKFFLKGGRSLRAQDMEDIKQIYQQL